MGRFDTTKATINANIKKNGNQEITGSILNSVMTEMVDATDAQLTELSEEVLVQKNYTEGAILGSTDNVIEKKGYAYSDYIPVLPSVYYRINYGEVAEITQILEYDENKVKVDYWNLSTTAAHRNITMNTKTHYIRFGFMIDNAKDVNVIKDGLGGEVIWKAEAEGAIYGVVEEMIAENVQLINDALKDIEDRVFVSTKTIDIPYIEKSAFVLNIGEAPVQASNNDYMAFVIAVKRGDVVTSYMRTGSSYKSYAKVKDGVAIEVGGTGVSIDAPIVCDGSFDTLIINNYSGYVLTPTAVLETKVIASPVAEKEIKILCFGNSFTQDSMSYVPFILQNIAPNIKLNLAIGYIGGCPLAQHCANLTGENQVLNGITYSPTNYTYQLYESGNAAWKSVGSKSIDEMLAEKEWDIITLQQNGSDAAQSWDVCYAPFIYKIHRLLAEKCGNSIKLGWLLVHGAYSSTIEGLKSNWQGSAENTQKIQDLTPNQLVFPYGTAVQNLRTTPLANLGDGGNLMGDTAHLHEGIGCLAAAYANTLTILDALGLGEVSIIGEDTRPTKAWCTEHGVLSPNYGATTNDVVGITEDNCFLAQVAAIQAVKKPYEISDLANFVA